MADIHTQTAQPDFCSRRMYAMLCPVYRIVLVTNGTKFHRLSFK